MDVNDFPKSFFKPQEESLPTTEDNSIADPYTPLDNRFAKNIPPELNRVIPKGSRLRRESSVRCELANISPGMFYMYKVEILENLCEKWAYQLNCKKTTKVYLWRGGDKWTQVDERVEKFGGKHFVILCPGGTLWESDEEPYVPKLPDIPDQIRVRQAVGIREGGQAYELDSEVFWKLSYPLVKTGPCTGKVTWLLIKRTQKFRMPEHTPEGPPVTEELRSETKDYRIPDCPKGTRAGEVSNSPDAEIAQVPFSSGRLSKPSVAADLSDRETVDSEVDRIEPAKG